jgi:GrpB-like predicted nucleotidyltransferase (UPF0157 family)
MQFRPEEENRKAVAAAFEVHRDGIAELLPAAQIEHIGATAAPGSLTKGDLDLLVRVATGEFDAAVTALRERYAVNQPESWTPEFASFEQEPAGEIPVGVQLVIAGGSDDSLFLEWRDRLRSDSELRERFNAFKRGQTGAEPGEYIEAKARFIEAELGGGIGGDRDSD